MNLRCNRRGFSNVFVLFLSVGVIFSGDGVLAGTNLIQQKSRPTIADLLNDQNPWPSTNPFIRELHNVGATFARNPIISTVGPDLARLIATIELAYPGATFAPLGRDVVFLGDAIDAFYTSIGQPGRVSRINASTETLKGAGVGDFLKLLAGAGFHPEEMGSAPSFVMFDRSEFRASGGSRQLVRFVDYVYPVLLYMHGAERAEDIARAFNAFSLNSSGNGSLVELQNQDDIENLRASQINDLASGTVPNLIGTFQNAFTRTLVDNAFEWHGSFGALATENGRYQGTTPGHNVNSTMYRPQILYELFEVYNDVSQPEFLAQVQEAANELGYDFPLTRQNAIHVEFNFDLYLDSFKKLINGLPPINEEIPTQKYFSQNAKALASWVESRTALMKKNESEEALLGLYAEGILVAIDKNLVTRKDQRRLIANFLSLVDSETSGNPSKQFLEWFSETYENDKYLKDLWVSRASYFLDEDTNRRGGISVPTMYRLFSDQVGFDPDRVVISNRCSLSFEQIPSVWQNLFQNPQANAE